MTTETDSSYFDRATAWADERDIAGAKARRIAWTVAGLAGAVAVLEAVALALAMPLKRVEPIAVLVDRTTGRVERVDLDDPQALRASAALEQSLLAQYVIARESYDPIGIRAAYRRVAGWSAGPARDAYLARMRTDPPSARLNAAQRQIGLSARVRGITMLADGSALVRFDVSTIDFAGRQAGTRPYAATIGFGFRGEPMTIEERLDNPLGFVVRSYRVDAETPPLADEAGARAGMAL